MIWLYLFFFAMIDCRNDPNSLLLPVLLVLFSCSFEILSHSDSGHMHFQTSSIFLLTLMLLLP